jgi:hypothetical protein
METKRMKNNVMISYLQEMQVIYSILVVIWTDPTYRIVFFFYVPDYTIKSFATNS